MKFHGAMVLNIIKIIIPLFGSIVAAYLIFIYANLNWSRINGITNLIISIFLFIFSIFTSIFALLNYYTKKENMNLFYNFFTYISFLFNLIICKKTQLTNQYEAGFLINLYLKIYNSTSFVKNFLNLYPSFREQNHFIHHQIAIVHEVVVLLLFIWIFIFVLLLILNVILLRIEEDELVEKNTLQENEKIHQKKKVLTISENQNHLSFSHDKDSLSSNAIQKDNQSNNLNDNQSSSNWNYDQSSNDRKDSNQNTNHDKLNRTMLFGKNNPHKKHFWKKSSKNSFRKEPKIQEENEYFPDSLCSDDDYIKDKTNNQTIEVTDESKTNDNSRDKLLRRRSNQGKNSLNEIHDYDSTYDWIRRIIPKDLSIDYNFIPADSQGTTSLLFGSSLTNQDTITTDTSDLYLNENLSV